MFEKKQTTAEAVASRVNWESLEEWARSRVQDFIQTILEEEVTEFLGRRKSERRQAVDAEPGYRNGYGKPRKLTMGCGTITVRRPRVRGLEERFESRILPLFVRRTKEINELLPELYLHGLAEGDFDLALRGLLGEDAPLSASTVARLKEKWQGEYEEWANRSLEELEVVYLWADGVYVKAGLEKDKAALLVALAGLSDGTKEFVAVKSGYRESTDSWSEVLRDLKKRGMRAPKCVVGDGHLGIWGGLRNVYSESEEQRCWNHKFLNILDKLPKQAQARAKALVRSMAYAESVKDAKRRKKEFEAWCRENGYDAAAECLDRDWDQLITFYRFPKEHWRHLRTTNPVESPFASLRLRTDAAKRYKKVANATAVIWKCLMVAEKKFRRLDAPELLKEVYLGRKFVNGQAVKRSTRKDAA